MEKENIVYYDDELNDELFGSKIEAEKIDGKYKYIHKNPFWNIGAFVLYRIIATPICKIYTKLKFNMKIENREVIKKAKDKGIFIYSNHTQEFLDVITPSLVAFPKRTYVVASPVNVSLKGTRTAVKMLGALPIPGDFEASKNFLQTLEKYINKKRAISIYPEAHVWPYYTKIRNFKETSFKYPVKMNVPSFAATTTYQKRKNGKIQITVYVDGPFYPNENLSQKEAAHELRDKIYNTMVERSKKSNIEVIKYVKKNSSIKNKSNIKI